jgi:singapore isolate B (sub-type 7) whole genome shotgun sequence assembly, scaffold_21
VGGDAVGVCGIPHFSHPNLPAGEQRKVFQTTPRGFRKVVLATGLAETGLTIDNITCVIDSGFETVSL